ncbi:unnamed protein product, partial [Acidithrix sp. C25]
VNFNSGLLLAPLKTLRQEISVPIIEMDNLPQLSIRANIAVQSYVAKQKQVSHHRTL